MSAYKKLNKQDIFITTYNAHKRWAITGSDLPSYGITFQNIEGKYINSLKQLYFPEYVTEEISSQNLTILSQSFDTYPQTTLTISGSKTFSGTGFIISIPKELYGNNISNDKSIELRYNTASAVGGGYVKEGYWQENYAVFLESPSAIIDDGEGNLYFSGSSPVEYVGTVNYSHGILYISDIFYQDLTVDTLTFKSSQTIYTHNINCKLRDFEFNYSTNPSTYLRTQQTTYDSNGDIYQQTGSVFLGDLKNNVTGSTFSPYITSVGLYNDANQLIAVGKVSRPLPKSLETETTIVVKLDI